MDSNHRRRTPADLQSAPFGHSGIFPYVFLTRRLLFAARLHFCASTVAFHKPVAPMHSFFQPSGSPPLSFGPGIVPSLSALGIDFAPLHSAGCPSSSRAARLSLAGRLPTASSTRFAGFCFFLSKNKLLRSLRPPNNLSLQTSLSAKLFVGRRFQRLFFISFAVAFYPSRLGCRADGGIRTPDQLITNQLLWPTELHRRRAFGLQR